ncbi:flagellar hook assembly protein FlgD [Acidisoma silvae]|uniref:Basal-body rod modification protein FlgD n=1 Tax=Acidisoma silvae TaxID=2802396 RepID=A0A964DYM7_9PROT|nr:flagellar hook capping FlgD N-terminal domain-containing protein [Acidisoma silvae]MCB8874908.1 flagellar hook capping protein [Acidisoma silvae]
MTNLAISNATAATAAAASTTAATGAASSGSAATMNQADFLQLLMAQLKYQSPTSPADPTQLASEFAQISTVTGINQLNSTVSAIQSGQAASQLAVASTLVGKQVTVAGDALLPDASGNATGAFSLADAAQNVTVTIIGANGTVAGTKSLGALPAGQQSFAWGGGSAGQSYTYQVSAAGADGTAVSVTPYTVYTVNGVSASGSTQSVDVQGQSAPIPISSIQSVLGGNAS